MRLREDWQNRRSLHSACGSGRDDNSVWVSGSLKVMVERSFWFFTFLEGKTPMAPGSLFDCCDQLTSEAHETA